MTVRQPRVPARLLFVVLSVLGGCTPSTVVESNKDQTYGQEPKRIFITLTAAPADFYIPFRRQISQRLAACDIAVGHFQEAPAHPNLEFDSIAEETLRAAKIAMIKRFAPDTILAMNETTGLYLRDLRETPVSINYFL
jgi:hypothetical protein